VDAKPQSKAREPRARIALRIFSFKTPAVTRESCPTPMRRPDIHFLHRFESHTAKDWAMRFAVTPVRSGFEASVSIAVPRMSLPFAIATDYNASPFPPSAVYLQLF
jgi:hypothetical protein